MISNFDRAYYRNSYQRTIDTTVSELLSTPEGMAVVLADTVFYPEGGGQPGDRGTLCWEEHGRQQQLAIKDTQVRQGTILHLPLTAAALPPVGSKVFAEINWSRRYDYMQQHSAEHIISGLAHQLFGATNVGFHISDELTTCDFDQDLCGKPLEEIITRANQAIWDNIPYQITYPDAEERRTLTYRSKIALDDEVRLVTVSGYDRCACSGTQVKTSGELGQIRALNCQHYKGGCRIELLTGARALRSANETYASLRSVGQSLSVPPAQVPAAVERLLNKTEQLQTELRAARQQQLERQLKQLPESDAVWLQIDSELDLKRSARLLATAAPGLYCAIQGATAGPTAFVLGKGSYEGVPAHEKGETDAAAQRVQTELNALRAECAAKGGGRGDRVSGTVPLAPDQLADWLEARGWQGAAQDDEATR